MEAFRQFYQLYGAELTVFAFIFALLALFITVFQSIRGHRQAGGPGADEESARQSTLITGLRRLTQQNSDRITTLEQTVTDLQAALARKAGRIGIVRFNPFHETGGDQSFSVAFLDDEGNGIVITSLYSRDGTRVYAKPIQNGQSPYPLMDEEVEALRRAQGKAL